MNLPGLILLLGISLLQGGGDPVGEVISRWGKEAPGEVRAHLISEDLAGADSGDLPALHKAAYGLFMEDMAAFRGRSGEVIARAMHGQAGATWSMICLSGSLLRTGQGDAAIEVVQDHLDRVEKLVPPAEARAIWDRMALVARGLGDVELMLDALGHSLVMGSEDALQILGWERLSEQDWSGSAQLFSTLLDRAQGNRQEPAPWALPGWGLSLLGASAE